MALPMSRNLLFKFWDP